MNYHRFVLAIAMSHSELIQKAEDLADQVLRQSKHILPHLARFCLVATFFEDGIRMWFQWSEQRDYIDHQWGCGWVLGTMFVLINLFGQLAGCFMVLARLKVDIAVGILFGIIVLQVCTMSVIINYIFLFKKQKLVIIL